MANNSGDVFELKDVKSYDESGALSAGVEEIEIGLIDTNPDQPRKNFDKDALAELAKSISLYGVIQPIIVAPKGGRYEIIAGERRYRATQQAGLAKIPAIVRDYDDMERKEIALIENLQREDLNPIEEAMAYKTLMGQYNLTQEELATKLGKGRPTVANSLRLLHLAPAVQEMLVSGRLTAGHARALVIIKDPAVQVSYAMAAKDKQLSVRQLEFMVQKYVNPEKKKKAPRTPLAAELKGLVNDMQRVFATKVKAVGSNDKGRIFIDYYTKDDLQRIFELIEVLKER
ncbi:MAG: ParB/RepB/Spo0J family partition protein [Clostridia bacterium]|nr:ParB/RepB/Spo0J family partition protein [Clostridia bacterium]